jgi:glutamyl-tRNA synthetase
MAFGLTPPKFAHIPMIMGADRARLSKRHGATSVIDYKTLGYLPEAMTNYIARLGWGHKDQEIFSRQELIEKFELNRVSKTPAIFDMVKLEWLNAHYIKTSSPEKIIELCMPFLETAYPGLNKNYAAKVIKCLQDRMKKITDIVPLSEYFFKDDYSKDQKTQEKYLSSQTEKDNDIRTKLIDSLMKIQQFNKESIEPEFKGLAEKENIKLGEIIHPTRALLTGRSESPGIYDVMEVLGKEKVLNRLKAI